MSPYIDHYSRTRFKNMLDDIDKYIKITRPGDLNYFITKILLKYIKDGGKPRYYIYNEVIGVLECIKQELYRRVVAVYEDVKKDMNGDVFYD